MALKDTTKHMKDLLNNITIDLQKAENGNKAASQRVRTGTVKLEKVAKMYRKESIKGEKQTKTTKKPAKKAAAAKPQKGKPAPAKKGGKTVAKAPAKAVKRPAAKMSGSRASF